MKALVLNSGLGHRMGDITKTHPKCMTEISNLDTILSRQLGILIEFGINDVVMTTGYHNKVLEEYCNKLNLPIDITFVNNPSYETTNYIYSIYCAKKYLLDDIILLHGDLVFEKEVLKMCLEKRESCMVVSSTIPLPKKDFKAVVEKQKIIKVGIDFFDNAYTAQPLYVLKKNDWQIWLERIVEYCEDNRTDVYAENALNEITDRILIRPLDVKGLLCTEIDNQEDLQNVKNRIK